MGKKENNYACVQQFRILISNFSFLIHFCKQADDGICYLLLFKSMKVE